jgi:hypothetical protein
MSQGIKVTSLTNLVQTASNDIMYVVDSTDTVSKKVELQNLLYDNMVTFPKLSTGVVIDDDTMNTAADNKLATSESIKAYVDNKFINSGFGTYDGGESVTLPNGLTMKFGTCTLNSNNTSTVSFGTNFSNVLQVQLTYKDVPANGTYTLAQLHYSSLTNSGFTVEGNTPNVDVTWLAIGR